MFCNKVVYLHCIEENNFNILRRGNRMPMVLHKYFPTISDSCWRCQEERRTLLHPNWNTSGKKCVESHNNLLITTSWRTQPSSSSMSLVFQRKHTKKSILCCQMEHHTEMERPPPYFTMAHKSRRIDLVLSAQNRHET